MINEEILRYVPQSHISLGIKGAQYINKLRLGYRGLWNDDENLALYSSDRTFCCQQKNKLVSTFLSTMDPFTLFSNLHERQNFPVFDEKLEKITSKTLHAANFDQTGEASISNQSQMLTEIYSTQPIFKFEFNQFSLKYNKAFLILKLGTENNAFQELSQIHIIYPIYDNKCSILLTEYKFIPRDEQKKEIVQEEVIRQVKCMEKIDLHHNGEIQPHQLSTLDPESLMIELQLPKPSNAGNLRKMTSVRKNSLENSERFEQNDISDEIKFENYMGPFDPSYPGNGEILMTPERIKVVTHMLKVGDHVREAIYKKHAKAVSKGKNIQLESNEINGHYIFRKDYELHSKGGLVYINAQMTAEQKKIITWVLKKISSSLLSGKGLMSISLPVTVFEPRSFLERFARSLGYAPDYLERAGNCADPVERLKLILSFFCGTIITCLNTEKPFNPVLGETFQARINGNLVYLEQVSHHPPISNYLLIGKSYRFYGSHLPLVNLSANSFVAELEGTPTIEFPFDKTRIKLKWPKFTMTGTTIGTRILNFFSKAIAYDFKNRLYAEINYNAENSGFFSGFSNKRIDVISGGIYSVDSSALLRLESEKKHFGFNLKPEEIQQKLSSITGMWDQHIEFDGAKYWAVDQNRPFLLEYELSPLPSDCTYRDDVLVMRSGDLKEAQNKKEQMEVSQRADKKLRDAFNKK